MADFAIALKERLAGHVPLTNLIGSNRLHWVKVPQGVDLPYVRLQVISDPRPQHLQGYDSARVSRDQCDCFSTKWGEARATAGLIVQALASPTSIGGIFFGRVTADGPRDLGEDVGDTFIHRASVDLLVEHRTL